MEVLVNLKNAITENNNQTFCAVKILLSVGGVVMIYNFVALASKDYQGFGIGLAGIAAGIAGKVFAEGK